jgi:hypothetical protein
VSHCDELLVGRSIVRGKNGASLGASGWNGAVVEASRVAFTGCSIGGGYGYTFDSFPSNGGTGLVVQDGSHVSLSGCPSVFGGGEGEKLCLCSTTGVTGDGMLVGDSTVVIRGAASDKVQQGEPVYFPQPGEGYSIHAQSGGLVVVSGVTLGQFDIKLDFGGIVMHLDEPEPFLELSGGVQPRTLATLNVSGPAGQAAWILVSPAASLTPVGKLDGPLWPATPWWLVSLVTTGAPLAFDTLLPAGLEGTTWYLQPVFPGLPGTLDPAKMFVGNPDVLLIRS